MTVEMKHCCEGSSVAALKLLTSGFSKFNRISIGVLFHPNYLHMSAENE